MGGEHTFAPREGWCSAEIWLLMIFRVILNWIKLNVVHETLAKPWFEVQQIAGCDDDVQRWQAGDCQAHRTAELGQSLHERAAVHWESWWSFILLFFYSLVFSSIYFYFFLFLLRYFIFSAYFFVTVGLKWRYMVPALCSFSFQNLSWNVGFGIFVIY